jgi:sec-independent protein translocase protein TatB
MSGVGFWELIILLLIGLIVLGPERLPRVANQLGTWIGQARRMTRVMKRQLEEELNLEKEPAIRPARLSAPQPQPPRKEHDDNYSPAHAPDSDGTDVGTDASDEPPSTGDSAKDLPRGEGDDAASQAAADNADGGPKNPQ